MIMRALTCLIAMASLSAAALAQSPQALFLEANEAFKREKNYEKAIDLYLESLQGAESAAVRHNLGNAWYKSGRIGFAVYNYEKSLALEPGHPDALANLNYLRQAAGLNAPERGPLERYAEQLSLRSWRWLAAVGFWGALALWILPRLGEGPNALMRVGFVGALALFLASLVGLFGYKSRLSEAIALAEDTPLRLAPDPESAPGAYLQEGELARVSKELDGWLFVRSLDGKSGWASADEAAKIWK